MVKSPEFFCYWLHRGMKGCKIIPGLQATRPDYVIQAKEILYELGTNLSGMLQVSHHKLSVSQDIFHDCLKCNDIVVFCKHQAPLVQYFYTTIQPKLFLAKVKSPIMYRLMSNDLKVKRFTRLNTVENSILFIRLNRISFFKDHLFLDLTRKSQHYFERNDIYIETEVK